MGEGGVGEGLEAGGVGCFHGNMAPIYGDRIDHMARTGNVENDRDTETEGRGNNQGKMRKWTVGVQNGRESE